jgi:prepilin-type processing-associated H-X9-DG protein
MHPGHQHASRLGFSTREILVFAALLILAVCVAIPYFLSQRKASARIASANNLQQWGIALNLYLIENNNTLPTVGSSRPKKEEPLAWYNALPPYLSQPALADLPPEEFPKPGDRSLWMDPAAKGVPTPGQPFFAYGMNRWLQPDPGLPACRIYELEDPSTVIFLAEVAGDNPGALPDTVDYRHGKKAPSPDAQANILYTDGHVETGVRKSELSDAPGINDPTASYDRLTWVPYLNAPAPKP